MVRQMRDQIEESWPKARSFALMVARTAWPWVDRCEVESAAGLALVHAAQTWDERRCPWDPWWQQKVRWALREMMRNADPLTRKDRSAVNQWEATIEAMHHRDRGGAPIPMPRAVALALAAADDPLSLDGEAVPEIAQPSPRRHEELAALERWVERLEGRERRVVLARLEEVPVNVIADDLGLTPSRASQIIREACKRMRRWAIEECLIDA